MSECEHLWKPSVKPLEAVQICGTDAMYQIGADGEIQFPSRMEGDRVVYESDRDRFVYTCLHCGVIRGQH